VSLHTGKDFLHIDKLHKQFCIFALPKYSLLEKQKHFFPAALRAPSHLKKQQQFFTAPHFHGPSYLENKINFSLHAL